MLFSAVELFDLPKTTTPDLAPLLPLSWTQIALGGGLHLPGFSAWLRGFPPEARITALASDRRIIAELVRTRSFENQNSETQELGRFQEAAILQLDSAISPDGDYRIDLYEETATGRKAKAIAHTSLKIRSASTSRLVPEDQRVSIGHPLDADGYASIYGVAINGQPAVVGSKPRMLTTLHLKNADYLRKTLPTHAPSTGQRSLTSWNKERLCAAGSWRHA